MPDRLISKYRGALGVTLASIFALCCTTAPAQAGFQWISPDASGVESAPLAPAYAPPPVVIGGSAGTVAANKRVSGPAASDDIISPVIIVGAAPETKAAPVVPSTSLSFDGISSDGQQAVSEPSVPPMSSMAAAPPAVKDVRPVAGSAPRNLGTLNNSDMASADASVPATAASATATADVPAAGNDVVRGFAKSVPLAVALRQILPGGYSFTIDQNVDMGTLVSFKGGHNWRNTLRDCLLPVGLVMHEQGQVVTISYASERQMADHVAAAGPAAGADMSALPPGEMAVAPQSILPSDSPMQPAAATPAPLPVRDVAMSGNAAAGAHMASADMRSDVSGRYNWAAERGDSLRKVLSEWSSRVHVEFNWMAEYDYPLEASFGFNGTFEEAVRDLLTGFEGAHPQPVAELHANPAIGQMVLIVQARGNTNTD